MEKIRDFCDMLSYHSFEESELQNLITWQQIEGTICGFRKSVSSLIESENWWEVWEKLLQIYNFREKLKNFLNSLKCSKNEFSQEFLALIEEFFKSSTEQMSFVYLNYSQKDEQILFLDNSQFFVSELDSLEKSLTSWENTKCIMVVFNKVSDKTQKLLLEAMKLPLFLQDKEMLLNFILNGQEWSFGFRLEDNKEIIFQYEDIFKVNFINRLSELAPQTKYCVNHNFKLQATFSHSWTQKGLSDTGENQKYIM